MHHTKIRSLRVAKHERQKDVADSLGVARATYAAYELGTRQPDHETLIKIAEHFDVSTDYLLKLDNNDHTELLFNLEEIEQMTLAYNGYVLNPKEKHWLFCYLKNLSQKKRAKKF